MKNTVKVVVALKNRTVETYEAMNVEYPNGSIRIYIAGGEVKTYEWKDVTNVEVKALPTKLVPMNEQR